MISKGKKSVALCAAVLTALSLSCTVVGAASIADPYFSVTSEDQINNDGKGAKGENSVAIGPGSTTKFRDSLSVGTSNTNEGYRTVLVGNQNKAYGLIPRYEYAIGATIVGTGNTIMSNSGVMALGSENIVHDGVAIGAKNKAMGENAVALGNFSSAMYTDSIGIGFGTHSYADAVIAIGRAAEGSALGGVAIGRYAKVNASTGVALGESSVSERGAGAVGYMPGAVGQTAEEVAAYLGKAEEYKSWKADVEANKDAYTRAKAWHAATDAERKAYKELNEARVAYAESSTEANKKAVTEKYDAWKKADAERTNTDMAMRQTNDYRTINDLNARYGQIFGKLLSTEGAVSVGDEKTGRTRQIINVAAGTKDTDAVNVYQLKAVQEIAAAKTTIEAGDNIKVEAGSAKGSYKISATDTYTTGGTYDAETKKLKFTQNDPSKNYEVDVAAMINNVVDTNTTYTLEGKEDKKKNTTTISLKGSDGNEQKVTVATKDTRNTIDTNSDTINVDATNKNADGSVNYKLNVKIGEVGKDNKGFVTGDTVYKETRVEKDGNYIKKDNTAGQNLTALDKGISDLVNGMGKLGTDFAVAEDGAYVKKDKTVGENLTAMDKQVKTNAEKIGAVEKGMTDLDKQVKANTGKIGAVEKGMTDLDKQVKTNTGKIGVMEKGMTDLNKQVQANAGEIGALVNGMGALDSRVNKVGAGSAALAALHPLDFDPEDKWNFAAGYGHYKGADAVAVGAFYRPDENKMVSIGGSFGNGENMINAGVSFKIGEGTSPYAGVSKAQLAQRISRQDEIIRRQDEELAAQKEQIREILAQLEAMKKA